MLSLSPAVIDELRDQSADQPGIEHDPLRQQTIDGIIRHNASAAVGFLQRFSDQALRRYLEHLEATSQPRGRRAVWVRPGDTSAVVTRTRND